ncbi:MAG TPA: hypothetical protein VGA20_00715 [Gemmatimonadales bacterium]
MKRYALLLGALITGSYVYAAQAAIAADLARVRVAMSQPADAANRDSIWYGGTLAPVTVEAWRVQPSAISSRAECKATDARAET